MCLRQNISPERLKPMYEFGYGLSYTTFGISGLKLNKTILNGTLTATVRVKNTGKVAGKEVVQVYVTAPDKAIDKPLQELRAFGKTKLLQPGETQTLTFAISAADVASYHTDKSEWITDAGKYLFKVGASSRDIRQTAAFSVAKTVVTEKVHDVLKPPFRVDELKAPAR
jgi:beta-glucosidase